MKQYLIAIAMVLALSSNANATAQKHRHTPRTEQVSDSVKHNQDAIEAFSDTTAATTNANADDDNSGYTHRVVYESDNVDNVVKEALEGAGAAGFMALLIPILAIVCVGFLLPIIIVLLVFYFINRNRKEKYRLAQMAIQNGQPIPDELLNGAKVSSNSSDYNAGIRQMFTGVGLAIFLGICAGEIGFGIGALVFFIGLGKWFIARQSKNDNSINPKNEEL